MLGYLLRRLAGTIPVLVLISLLVFLLIHAAPGEILVSELVQTATATEFAFTAYPALRVNGKTDPQAVFAVLGAHQHRARLNVATRKRFPLTRTSEIGPAHLRPGAAPARDRSPRRNPGSHG